MGEGGGEPHECDRDVPGVLRSCSCGLAARPQASDCCAGALPESAANQVAALMPQAETGADGGELC